MGAESELVLHNLAEKSFLSLWSYPNPYTDNSAEKSGVGKELCDLLIIFGNDVIIFSDKSCAYPNTGNDSLDWKRWYKRAVSNSISQIYGAERWLKEYPRRIYSDIECKKTLAAKIPSKDEIKVHRVVVALGSCNRCREFFNGGSGSLLIHSNTSGVNDGERKQFQLGNDGNLGKFVHVFDDITLQILLKELDTTIDFIQYLVSKEKAFSNYEILATGEEDLLGHYLAIINQEGNHDFVEKNTETIDGIFIAEDSYESLKQLPQYKNSKIVNQPSYFWDNLIEHFIKFWRLGNIKDGVTAESVELSLRLMASTGRLTRRILGSRLQDALRTPQGMFRYMATADKNDPNLIYGFVIAPQKEDISRLEYRKFRQTVMSTYGNSLKVRLPTLERALILGFNSQMVSGDKSEDLVLMNFENWSQELEEITLSDMAHLGLGSKVEGYMAHEFPLLEPKSFGGREALRRLKQMAKLKIKNLN